MNRRLASLLLSAVIGISCGGNPSPGLAPAQAPRRVSVEVLRAEIAYADSVSRMARATRRAGEFMQQFQAAEGRAFSAGQVSAADHATVTTSVKYLAREVLRSLEGLKSSLDSGAEAATSAQDSLAEIERLFASFLEQVPAVGDLPLRAERVRSTLFVLSAVGLTPRPAGGMVNQTAVAPVAVRQAWGVQ